MRTKGNHPSARHRASLFTPLALPGAPILLLFTLSLWRAVGTETNVATIYRDEFGIPHVFAPTLESAAYAVGYAQAEDRLEELLKNYRKANGTMAEVFGPEYFRHDLIQRMWRHAEIS